MARHAAPCTPKLRRRQPQARVKCRRQLTSHRNALSKRPADSQGQEAGQDGGTSFPAAARSEQAGRRDGGRAAPAPAAWQQPGVHACLQRAPAWDKGRGVSLFAGYWLRLWAGLLGTRHHAGWGALRCTACPAVLPGCPALPPLPSCQGRRSLTLSGSSA